MTDPERDARPRPTWNDVGRALDIAAVVIFAMIVLTLIFGVQQPAATYDIVPDPASLSGLPF